MKFDINKIITILIVVLLVGTIGATTVSASGFLSKPGFRDLVNQWNEIQSKKQDLHNLLVSYGVDLPDLTIEQKRELLRTIIELRRNGTDRDEIHEIVFDMLIGYGMDLPDLTSEQFAEIRQEIKTHLEENYGFIFVELSDAQKMEIKNTIRQMKKDGATREEIKQAVIDLYESYGGVIPDLSDVQKEEIHNWVANMLEIDYGFDLPNLSYEQRQQIKEKRTEIRELQGELRDIFKDARFFTKIRFIRYVKTHIS